MTTTVVHCKRESFDVYIGRPGILGNEFVIGIHGTREEVIAKKRAAILADPELVKWIKKNLTGKRLGCYCKPLACHGDIYVEICDQ